MRRWMAAMIPRPFVAAFAIWLCAPTCSRAADVTVVDAAGRTVMIAESSRIVSVGGAITEILYALGLEQRVIGVDSTSLFPERALADKPSVGYMRQLSAEGVLGLSPTLVLAAQDAGPKETIAVLEGARVPFVLVPDRYSGGGVLDKIRIVSTATNMRERGECLAKAVEADLTALDSLQAHQSRPRRVLFILSLANDRIVVAGRNTAADGILK